MDIGFEHLILLPTKKYVSITYWLLHNRNKFFLLGKKLGNTYDIFYLYGVFHSMNPFDCSYLNRHDSDLNSRGILWNQLPKKGWKNSKLSQSNEGHGEKGTRNMRTHEVALHILNGSNNVVE